MNFDFSDDQKQLRDQAWRFLAEKCTTKHVRQVHGGMGFTWEFDCHLYYRRSNALALCLGSMSYWEDQLIDRMRARNASAA